MRPKTKAKIKLRCDYCHNVIYLYKSQVSGHKYHFCNKICYDKWQEITCTGKNNANYKDGKCCEKSLCKCGKEKDFRAIRCIGCRRGWDIIPDNKIIEAVKTVKTFLELSEYFGVSRKWITNRVKLLNIDINHFKRCRSRPTKPEDILVINSFCSRLVLKDIIIKNNLIKQKCDNCNVTDEWNGKPLILELHHKNGINNDNRLENLIFLCPNCHSQTDTNKGKNRHRKRGKK